MNKCFGLWSKQRWKQHRCTAEALEGGEVSAGCDLSTAFISPSRASAHVWLLPKALFFFLSFFPFFFLQHKRVKANKNTRRTYMFLILFFKRYRHMHRAVQVRRELKWHSLLFSVKKKNNIEQVTGIQRHLEKVGNILRLYKALPDVL